MTRETSRSVIANYVLTFDTINVGSMWHGILKTITHSRVSDRTCVGSWQESSLVFSLYFTDSSHYLLNSVGKRRIAAIFCNCVISLFRQLNIFIKSTRKHFKSDVSEEF